jgi:hypothetical protein
MGILVDFRQYGLADDFELAFTQEGHILYRKLKPLLDNMDLSFTSDDSWNMRCRSSVNQDIRNFLAGKPKSLIFVRKFLLEMDAVSLLLQYLYTVKKKSKILKSEIYDDFFEIPFVKNYLAHYGLKPPTHNIIIRRIPFLFNVLDALGIINQTQNEIEVLSFIPARKLMRFNASEKDDVIYDRISKLNLFAETGKNQFSADETALLRKIFGARFLTDEYYLKVEKI